MSTLTLLCPMKMGDARTDYCQYSTYTGPNRTMRQRWFLDAGYQLQRTLMIWQTMSIPPKKKEPLAPTCTQNWFGVHQNKLDQWTWSLLFHPTYMYDTVSPNYPAQLVWAYKYWSPYPCTGWKPMYSPGTRSMHITNNIITLSPIPSL